VTINGLVLPKAWSEWIKGKAPADLVDYRSSLLQVAGKFLPVTLYTRESSARETKALIEYGSPLGPTDSNPKVLWVPDTAKAISIGDTGCDAPICLYFDSPDQEPRVIWQDDWFVWQPIANSIHIFIASLTASPSNSSEACQ
jgi:hypothetical protein